MRNTTHTKRYPHDNDREPQARPQRDRGSEDVDDQDDGTQVKGQASNEAEDIDKVADGEDHTLERLANHDDREAPGPDA